MSSVEQELARGFAYYKSKLGATSVKEAPAIVLPMLQRALNPIAGTVSFADIPQPWYNIPVAFNVNFFVVAPNSGINFWTITLNTVNVVNTSTPIATLSTAAYVANTPTRAPTIVTFSAVPASSDPYYRIDAVVTGTPGALFLWPMLSVLRLGN